MSIHVNCFLDEPAKAIIDRGEIALGGWISAKAGGLERIALRSIRAPVRLSTHGRPDVSSAYPDRDVVGFSGTLRIADHLAAVRDSHLILYLMCGSRVVGGFRFKVEKRALRLAAQVASSD